MRKTTDGKDLIRGDGSWAVRDTIKLIATKMFFMKNVVCILISLHKALSSKYLTVILILTRLYSTNSYTALLHQSSVTIVALLESNMRSLA
jgi:hypothetical protein